jgi:hypothetical protein
LPIGAGLLGNKRIIPDAQTTANGAAAGAQEIDLKLGYISINKVWKQAKPIPGRIVTDSFAFMVNRGKVARSGRICCVIQISYAPVHAVGYPGDANVVSWGSSVILLWFPWRIIRAYGHGLVCTLGRKSVRCNLSSGLACHRRAHREPFGIVAVPKTGKETSGGMKGDEWVKGPPVIQIVAQ